MCVCMFAIWLISHPMNESMNEQVSIDTNQTCSVCPLSSKSVFSHVKLNDNNKKNKKTKQSVRLEETTHTHTRTHKPSE